MQAFVDQVAVLRLLLVFIIKIISSYGSGHTQRLLSQFVVLFNGLYENTTTNIYNKTDSMADPCQIDR